MDFEGVETSSSTGREVDPTPVPMRATKDEKLVRGGRITVMTVLLLSAIGVASLAFVLLSKSEYSSFKAQVRMLLSVLDRMP
jgi:hypothetical protein